MMPLMKKGSWLYVYNQDFRCKMLRIPLGGYLVVRDDVYHGGFCGLVGNVRMQIPLIPKQYISNFCYLQHASNKVGKEKGFFYPKAVDYGKSVHVFLKDVTNKLTAQKNELETYYPVMDKLYSGS